MVHILLVAFVAALLLGRAVAPAHAATTYTVCASGCNFTSIQAAVDAATAGDTVAVRAGTYFETVDVAKAITIAGPQVGVDGRTRAVPLAQEAIVTGGLSPAFTLRAAAVLDGLTVAGATNAAGVSLGAAGGGSQVRNLIVRDNAVGIDVSSAGAYARIERNRISDNDAQPNGAGIRATHDLLRLEIFDNLVTGHEFAAIDLQPAIDADGGGDFVAIDGNELEGAGSLVLLRHLDQVAVSGNVVHGVAVGTAAVGTGIHLAGGTKSVVVADNTVTSTPATATTGILVEPEATLVNGAIDVLGNTVVHRATGIRVAPGALDVEAEIHRNQLAQLTTAIRVEQDLVPIDAENNWFGCNTGPGGACPAVVDTGDVNLDVAPWVVVGVGLDADPLAGSTAYTVRASALRNSAGALVTGGDPVPDGTPVSFAASAGVLAPSATTISNGEASTTWTSPADGGEVVLGITVDGRVVDATTRNVARPEPINTVVPSTLGTARLADTLTCLPGTWTRSPTFAYQWRSGGSPLAGATSANYVVQAADVGATLTCRVTATTSFGISGSATTAGVVATLGAPVNNTAPTIDANPATPRVGDTLTCVNGTWTDGVTFTRAWYRNGAAIDAATAATRVVAPEDVGAALTCRVTATRIAGASTTATSASVVPVLGAPTIQSGAIPVISGTTRVGDTLVCSNGTWNRTSTFTRQWLRAGAPIADQTGTSYVVQLGDVGAVIGCEVTATVLPGVSGTASATPVAAVSGAPVSTAAPAITGVARIFDALACSDGTWNRPGTYSRAWLRDGAPIAGETSTTYTIRDNDVGVSIVCRVTNTVLPGVATSADSAPVVPSLGTPVNTASPVVTGDPNLRVGDTLSCSTGTWSRPGTYTYEWYRNGVVDPISTGSSTYVVRLADATHQIRCEVTDYVAPGVLATASSAAVTALLGAPTASVAPSIQATLQRVGDTLTCQSGTWSRPSTFGYEWLRDSVAIEGATATTYVVTSADVDKSVACRVTATVLPGVAGSSTSLPVVPTTGAPTNSVAPGITGTARVADVLTCSPGTWSRTSTYAYAWYRAGETDPVGTGNTRVVAYADVDLALTCRVTATAPSGATGTAMSAPVTPAAGFSVNTAAPTIAGTVRVGSTVTCTNGTWTRSPQFSRQWLLDGIPVVDATGSTYAVLLADAGKDLTCAVTARPVPEVPQIATTVSSLATEVSLGAPTATALPTLAGQLRIGDTVTCQPGTWSSAGRPLTYSYEWLLDADVVTGATAATFVPVPEQVGRQLRCRVTAEVQAGVTGAATSAAGSTIVVGAPTNTVLPTLSGSPAAGETLTCAHGTWNSGGRPLSYTYAWRVDGVAVTGETASTFTVRGADVGHDVSCRVTAAVTAAPTVTAVADTTTVRGVTGAPINQVAPTITAPGVRVSDLVTCQPGTWSKSATYAFAWLRGGAAIAGATDSKYTIAKEDVGASLACRVTATPVVGEPGVATTLPIQPVLGVPVNSVLPAISGFKKVGDELTCSTGTWDRTPTFTYEWLRNGAPIAGATTRTYVVLLTDPPGLISCRVTATQAVDVAASATSSPVTTELGEPVNSVPPSLGGAARVGEELVCNIGTWSRTPIYGYQWLRNGAPIADATGATYRVQADDARLTLSCRVTATAASGVTAAATTAPVFADLNAPTSSSPPTISGKAAPGSTLTCAPGSWSREVSYAYLWLRDGKPVPAATTSTYAIQFGDAGSTLTCKVTVTTATGASASATSAGVKPGKVAQTLVARMETAAGGDRKCGTSTSRPCADTRAGTIRVGGTLAPARAKVPVIVVFERLRGTKWVLSLTRTTTTSATGRYSVAVPGRFMTTANWRVRARAAAETGASAANSPFRYFKLTP